jgi:hypothetical protein
MVALQHDLAAIERPPVRNVARSGLPCFDHGNRISNRPHNGCSGQLCCVMFKTLLQRLRCKHEYKFSRSKPGTLVCKKCHARKGKP